MTATNNEIRIALNDRLIAEMPAYAGKIAFPGVDFTPPAAGMWLQVSVFPNRGVDQGLAYDSSVVPQGIYQVMVCGRKSQQNEITMGSVAQIVKSAFPKGAAVITGSIKVWRNPYEMEMIEEGDRLLMPVTIEYTG